MVKGFLDNKLRDLKKDSNLVAALSEIYLICPGLLPPQHERLNFTLSLIKCVAEFPNPPSI